MRSHTLLGDHVLPRKCEVFLSMHLPLLTQYDLRQQFMLHLFNLWDNSLLSSIGVAALMKRYDAFALDEKENRNVKETCAGDKAFDTDDIIASQTSSLKRKRAIDGLGVAQAQDDSHCNHKIAIESERQQALGESARGANSRPKANSEQVSSSSSEKPIGESNRKDLETASRDLTKTNISQVS